MGKKKGAHQNKKSQKNAKNARNRSVSESSAAANTSKETHPKEIAKPQLRKRLPRACKTAKFSNDAAASHFGALGLQVRSIMGDGNCMFRAFSDQLEGNEASHTSYRSKIVDYITEHIAEFEIYHEQEEEKTFSERLKKLRKNATYGGNESLVAFARIFERVVYVHQHDEGKSIIAFPPCHSKDIGSFKQVHLLYSSGNHYDSLRKTDETNSGSPADVHISPKTLEEAYKRGQSVDSGIATSTSSDDQKSDVASNDDQQCEVVCDENEAGDQGIEEADVPLEAPETAATEEAEPQTTQKTVEIEQPKKPLVKQYVMATQAPLQPMSKKERRAQKRKDKQHQVGDQSTDPKTLATTAGVDDLCDVVDKMAIASA